MDSGRPKSLNSDDSASCRISMYDDGDDDDEDTADRVGIIDYCLPPKTSNGTTSSPDNNYSLNEKPSPRSKGSPCNDYANSNSYAKDQFEKQVAARDAIDHRLLIDRFQHLYGFGGSARGAALNSETASDLEKTGAEKTALDSLYQAEGYNELVHKNNSEIFDEELSCESDEPEPGVADQSCCDDVTDDACRMEYDEPCCDIEDERRIEFNALVHKSNSEQFDEALWIESDDDVEKTAGIPQRGFYSVDDEKSVASNSEPMELLADSFLDRAGPRAGTNGYDAASHRRAYSSKYSSGGATLSAVDRCSNLLSTCAYMGGRSAMMDFEKKMEQPRPLVCSDQEGEADVSCGVGNYQAIQSDDSDDCERSSELNLQQHQPFFSRQDDFRSEGGTGDWLFRGNPLHASGLRGYQPQYHLTRYGFGSELEQPNLSSRYYQLRQRRQSKRERQDAAVVNSTDVPGYKGNLGVEELLSYINDSNGLGHRSEGHGGVDAGVGRSAEKPGRRRKKGSKEKADKTESGSKSTDRRTGGARVDSSSAVKANDRARVISACKLANCVDAVSDDETIAVEQKDLASETIGESSDLDLQVVCCDIIPQGNTDSIRTVAVDHPLEKSLAPSSSFPVLRAMSVDVPLQRAASTEDDFTMVTKKKKSKKGNSKRGKPPRSDGLPCFSSDSTVSERDLVFPLTSASKESASFSGYHARTRSSALSKSSSAFRSSAFGKTVNNDSGFYLDAEEDDWLADEIETEVTSSKDVVPVVTAVQNMPAAAPERGESNTDDSVAGRSVFLSSPGSRPTLQSREKPEPTAKTSSESIAKDVTEEKRRNSKRPRAEKSKDLSVKNLETSPSGWQQNLSQNDVTKPQSLSQDENTKPRQLFQEEEVISQKLSQEAEASSGNLSRDKKVISGNVFQDNKVISGNVFQDSKVISGNVFQDEELIISGNLSQDITVEPHERPLNSEEVISQTLAQDESEAFELTPQQPPQNDDASLSENPSQYETQMSEHHGRHNVSDMLTRYEIETSQIPFPVERSLPHIGSPPDNALFSAPDNALFSASPDNALFSASPNNALFSAQAASVNEAFEAHSLPPAEQPVVFLDRQRRLFSVPAKRDLGLKFGHFDDCESAPDESRGSPLPPYPSGPINVIHYIPVPYNHDDGGGQDKPLPDSNSMMFPIPHQYLPQLMYANGPLHQPMCKPAFQVYPNGHMFPVPMQFAPFVPPGFCVLPPHTTNVPVGVVSPTMNNRPRDETSLSSECADGIPIISDGSDSCVPGFSAMQGIVMPVEPIVQAPLPLQPVPADAVLVASVSLSTSRRSKSAFNVKAAVEYIYSEWLAVIRREHGPNGVVVRYNPELDL